VLLLVALLSFASGCSPGQAIPEVLPFDEPGGRYSLLLPVGWEMDPTSSTYHLFAVPHTSGSGAPVVEAWVGLTWRTLPCDRSMIDDAVSWYADVYCWEAGAVQSSHDETRVDGQRALLLDCVTTTRDLEESRQLTLITQAYGALWQVTCGVADATRYPALEPTFRAILESVVIRGSWSAAAA
jgi:hypothetical protein